MSIRIEVRGAHAGTTQSILRNAAVLGVSALEACHIAHIYFLAGNPGAESINRLCTFLLADPITEKGLVEFVSRGKWRVNQSTNGAKRPLWDQLLLALLSHPNVASREGVIRTYDHEVRGGTLVRLFTGPLRLQAENLVAFRYVDAGGVSANGCYPAEPQRLGGRHRRHLQPPRQRDRPDASPRGSHHVDSESVGRE